MPTMETVFMSYCTLLLHSKSLKLEMRSTFTAHLRCGRANFQVFSSHLIVVATLLDNTILEKEEDLS